MKRLHEYGADALELVRPFLVLGQVTVKGWRLNVLSSSNPQRVVALDILTWNYHVTESGAGELLEDVNVDKRPIHAISLLARRFCN